MRGLKKFARDVRHRSALLIYPSVLVARLAFSVPTRRAAAKDVHVLLAPPGGGNIGDQAMVESFVENVHGPVRIIVTGASAISFRGMPEGRVEPVVLPHLIYGRGLAAHVRDVRALRRVLDGAASFSVVGADIMDGAYNLRASMRRALVAELAAGRGVDTRVLGFSWNEKPHPAARRALRAASSKGSVLMLRDPRSAARARHDGLANVVPVADTVFSLLRTDSSAADAALGDVPPRSRVALVNASALVARSLDQAEEYARIIRHLHDSGFRVVLLPHVSVPGADDLVACRAVHDRVGPGIVTFIDHVVTPAEIKGLCARSDLVVTGRMHLAVMALSAGVPAITMATQGKVEGLMEIFGTTELCVSPRPGVSDRVIELIDRIGAESSPAADRVREGLPLVRQMSAQNFAGLQAPGERAAHTVPSRIMEETTC